MSENITFELGPRPQGFDSAKDRTVFWTLSIYIPQLRLTGLIGKPIKPEHALLVQFEDERSMQLRDAIEPLFNDIADRERLGKVEDTLLAASSDLRGETIAITMPSMIEWETEGKRFRNRPVGLDRPREVVLRRFWFAHNNGALSYHLSFQMCYDHTPGDFYFLSMIQKALAPKEFAIRTEFPAKLASRQVSPLSGLPTGCLPIDQVHICENGRPNLPFWEFVKLRFEADASDLVPRLASKAGGKIDLAKVTAEALIEEMPFIEVAGLNMPLSRFMFFFQDKVLFERLMPPSMSSEGVRPRRSQMCQEKCYWPYTAKIEELIKKGAGELPPLVDMDGGYWEWVRTRPDYAELLAGKSEAERTKFVAAMQAALPSFNGDWSRPDCLQFLFLSGFTQNIIDFMNQDASEIQDSLDPIYPANNKQEDESFFVRFANPRALISFVAGSRSLETGQDYIGNCPYAFLIHVSALHNEFIGREYEQLIFDLMSKVEEYNRKGQLKKAANAFYAFRTGAYSDFHLARYQNHFRYDTERDVFASLERLRGTSRRETMLESLVQNMESQTRDLEARTSKQDEQRLSLLIGALGIFSLFQLAFNWADSLRRQSEEQGLTLSNLLMEFGAGVSLADQIELWALRFSIVCIAGIVAYAIYFFVRRMFP